MDFFLACSLLRLNSLPPVRYRMSKPELASRKASVSIAENIMLNSVGARTQPCFTPFVTGKGVEDSLSSRSLHSIVKRSDHLDEFVWASELAHDLPETVAADGVECFGEVDKCCVKVDILFLAFFLQLTCSKYHVGGTSLFPESTLALWK